MITILTWISLICGGILVLLLLLSVLGGLDLDIDIPSEVDVDADSGGLGIIKSVLTFLSVGSWVVKLVITTSQHPIVAFACGIFAGIVAVALLSFLLRLLLKQQKEVVWNLDDALYREYKVYLKIPASEGGNGIINININDVTKEIKAITKGNMIPSGSLARVIEILENNAVLVEAVENNLNLPSSKIHDDTLNLNEKDVAHNSKNQTDSTSLESE